MTVKNSTTEPKKSHNRLDLKGLVFGKLAVIEYCETKNNRAVWKCACSCGEICNKSTKYLTEVTSKSGVAKSCGCEIKPRNKGKTLTYGMKYTLAKECPICGVLKKRDDYSCSNETHDSLSYECRQCASVRYKKYRKDNLHELKAKDRASHYVKKYGLSKEEAIELVKNRVGVCEICQTETSLVIDHCHTNGHVRGKVCNACNSALGYARDSIEILQNCINYLIKDSKRS